MELNARQTRLLKLYDTYVKKAQDALDGEDNAPSAAHLGEIRRFLDQYEVTVAFTMEEEGEVKRPRSSLLEKMPFGKAKKSG